MIKTLELKSKSYIKLSSISLLLNNILNSKTIDESSTKSLNKAFSKLSSLLLNCNTVEIKVTYLIKTCI